MISLKNDSLAILIGIAMGLVFFTVLVAIFVGVQS